MSQHSRVAWKDGMFLLPQHFQQAERSMDAILRTAVLAPQPLGWGVLELVLDRAAIGEGRVEIERCRAVLPDGAVVDIPAVDPPPIVVPLHPADGERHIEVFLTLPTRHPQVPLVAASAQQGESRFVERPFTVGDDLDPGQQQTIDVAMKNLQLALSPTALAGRVALKLAEVERTEEGQWTLRPDYVPPCPLIHAAPALLQQSKELLRRAGAKLDGLTARRQQAGEAQGLDAPALREALLLHALHQSLPVLWHLVRTPDTHPAALFQELLRLAGSLRAGMPDGGSELPAYDHQDLGPRFAALFAQLDALLAVVARERHAVIPLTWTQNAWDGRIEDAQLLAHGEFYLVASGALPSQELERLPGACKIADSQRVEKLVLTASPGLQLAPVARPREPIPVRKDAAYYRLATEGPLWQEIQRSGQIGVFIPRAPAGLQLELVALRPGRTR
jgi:type VI secretion system protein ImpJ